MVVEVDADGDTKVDFPCHDARQWAAWIKSDFIDGME